MSYQGETDIDLDIDIDARIIAQALLSNGAFIRQVAAAVLVELTKMVRRKGNLFGANNWAQRRVPNGVKNQVPGTKRIN